MRSVRQHLLVGFGCALVLLTTACGGGTSGKPSPTVSDPSATAPAPKWPKNGAPDIPNPLDVSTLTSNPCEVLTKQQVESFPGSLSEDTHSLPTTAGGAGKACSWIFTGKRYSIGAISGGIVPPTSTHHGLSSIYDGRESADVFRPITVHDYPAVIYSATGAIGSGACRMSVGLRNDTAYRIQTGLAGNHPSYEKPCRMAKKLAGYIVRNLKEAQ